MPAQTASPERLIYLAACKLQNPELRREYLDEACGADDILRKRLDALLGLGSDESKDPLHQALEELGHSPVDNTPGSAGRKNGRPTVHQIDETVDARINISQHPVIGRYKLLEELGLGGMGAVYMAQQTAPVKRKVALKIIKPGMDSREVIVRFQAERQALAMMDHPNIARVLDAGTTDEGRPYFVMELVRGIPITKFCKQKKLSLEERLKLFIDVCKAVQHAHQKAIIHRDLKPSNILVTLHDGEPVVKVIDFGVAKALNQDLTDQTLCTQFSQMIGTPLYMSPEQAEMSGLDVDTRSDIYSLGVVLYELLTGSTPIEREAIAKLGIDAIRQLIREQEPERPSSRISTLKAHQDSTLKSDKLPKPKIVANQLSSELDWIVLKALEKDRTRRYDTSNGLAADVKRYLHGDAVEACPPSIVYRLRKIATRNRGMLASAALIFVSLLAGLYTSLRYAQQSQNSATQAQAAKEEAEKEAAISKAVTAFVSEDLLAQASPNNQPNPAVTLREVVDRASEKLAGRFDNQPLIEAAIRVTLAETYFAIGKYDQSREHADRALSLRRKTLGLDDPSTIEPAWLVVRAESMGNGTEIQLESLLARARRQLGDKALLTMKMARALASEKLTQGDASTAEKQTLENLRLVGQVFDDTHSEWFSNRRLLAEVYSFQGRYSEAVDVQKANLKKQVRMLGEEHPNSLSSMTSLAKFYLAAGDTEQAEQLSQKAYQTSQRVLGAENVGTLNAKGQVVSVLHAQGRLDEAERLIREIVEVESRVLGPDHNNTLISITQLGNLLNLQTRYEEAEELFNELIQVQKRVLGAAHHSTLGSLNSLANLYFNQGRYDEARKLHAELLASARKTFGEEHPNTLASMSNLAQAYANQQRYDEAEQLIAEVIETQQRLWGKEHASTLKSMLLRVTVLMGQGRYLDAESLLHSLIETHARVFGEEHVSFFTCKRLLGHVMLARGRYDEAESQLREFIEFAKHNIGAENGSTLQAMSGLGEVLIAQARYKEAEELVYELWDVQKRVLGSEHPVTLGTMHSLAIVYRKQKRNDESEKLNAKLVEVARQKLGPEHPNTLVSMGNLADDYRLQGRFKEAEQLLDEVIEIQNRVLGKDHPGTMINVAIKVSQLLMQKRCDEAEPLLESLLENSRRVLGDEHPHTISRLSMMAYLLELQERPDEAILLRQSVSEIYRRVLGEEHLYTLNSQQRLAALYEKQERFDEAEALLVESVGILQGVQGEKHQTTQQHKRQLAALRLRLGESYRSQGDMASAMEAFNRALRDDPEDPALRHTRAMLWFDLDQPDKAQADLDEALRFVRNVEVEPKSIKWELWNKIAISHYRRLQWRGAEREAELAVRLADGNPGRLVMLSPFFLLAGENENFHHVCLDLLAKQDALKGNDLGEAIKLCSMDPFAYADDSQLRRLAQRATDEGPWWAHGLVAIVYARLGETLDAYEAFARGKQARPASDNPGDPNHPLDSLNKAMILQLCGDSARAAGFFKKGQETADGYDFQYATTRMETLIRLHELSQRLPDHATQPAIASKAN